MIPERRDDPPPVGQEGDIDPLGFLPRLSARQVRLERWLAEGGPFLQGLRQLAGPLGLTIGPEPPEVRWWASALKRTGLAVQLSWARLQTRLALGLETPLVHGMVDQLLGYDRPPEQGLLQVTPVEWGVATFLAARVLGQLRSSPGPWGPWDLTLDRVGPDSFDARGLGELVSIRTSASAGGARGSIWFWLPESLVSRWLAAQADPPIKTSEPAPTGTADLTSWWRAEAGEISLLRGLGTLRVGGVLPLSSAPLKGSPQNLTGAIDLALTSSAASTRYWFDAEPAPYSGGARLVLTSSLQRRLLPREALAVNPPNGNSPAPGPDRVSPTDVPVTLVVELGRVNLSLAQLAGLKPGDVVELGRHSREPVELTSGGRLVARGELIQIDTELGIRLTNVFL